MRARARVHWVCLGSWMLPLCWHSICARACVRIKRTPSIPDTPYLPLGWADRSGVGILRSHDVHNSAVIGLLATPFVSKPYSHIMDSYGFGGQESVFGGFRGLYSPIPLVGDRSNLQFPRREAELTQALLPTDGRSRTLLRGEIRRSLVCVQKNYNPPQVGVMETTGSEKGFIFVRNCTK